MDIKRFLDHHGTLLWTMTSNGYKYLTLNLIESLKLAKVPIKICVVCVDKESLNFLRGQGVDCILYSETIQSGQVSLSQWNTDTFHKITRFKLTIMDEFIKNPQVSTIIYMDGDIIIKKDFIPWVESTLKKGTWYFQCDEATEQACSSPENCPNFCTGFIIYKKGEFDAVNPFTLSNQLWSDCKSNHDQEYVQRRIRELGLAFQTLDRHDFPNGKMIKHAKEPFIRHYNYRIGTGKQGGMKQRGDWYIPY